MKPKLKRTEKSARGSPGWPVNSTSTGFCALLKVFSRKLKATSKMFTMLLFPLIAESSECPKDQMSSHPSPTCIGKGVAGTTVCTAGGNQHGSICLVWFNKACSWCFSWKSPGNFLCSTSMTCGQSYTSGSPEPAKVLAMFSLSFSTTFLLEAVTLQLV